MKEGSSDGSAWALAALAPLRVFAGLPKAASSPLGTLRRGTSVTPMPAATMCLMVSSEEPSKLLLMPSVLLEKRANSGQTSSTWSRKQWPLPSKSMVCCLSSSAVILLRAASG